MRALGIIGTLLVVGGAVLCIGGVVRWRRAADLAARGEVAEGDVVGATEVRGGRGSRSYRLAVEFPAGGKRYRKSFVVSKATFDARAAGVRVQYLAEDPARSRVDEGPPRPGEEIGMAAALGAVGVSLLVARARRLRRARGRPEPQPVGSGESRRVLEAAGPRPEAPRATEARAAGPRGSGPTAGSPPDSAPVGARLSIPSRLVLAIDPPDAPLVLDPGTIEATFALRYIDRPAEEDGWDTIGTTTRFADRRGVRWEVEGAFLADELVLPAEDGGDMCHLADSRLEFLDRAPREWIDALEARRVLSGARAFSDSRTGAVLTVSGTRYDLVVKYLGATVGLALLPDPGGDRFVVEVSGVHDGEGEPVPAFAYLVSCEKLLLRNSATFDEEDGWWTAADLPLRARRIP